MRPVPVGVPLQHVAEHLQADLVVAWDAVTEAFGDHKPAGTLLGVTVLAYDDQLVEIDAVPDAVAHELIDILATLDDWARRD